MSEKGERGQGHLAAVLQLPWPPAHTHSVSTQTHQADFQRASKRFASFQTVCQFCAHAVHIICTSSAHESDRNQIKLPPPLSSRVFIRVSLFNIGESKRCRRK